MWNRAISALKKKNTPKCVVEKKLQSSLVSPELCCIQEQIQQEMKTLSSTLDRDKRVMLSQMKKKGYDNELLNQFKLMIYEWNIEDAMKYYENDKFCIFHCIVENGCIKDDCEFEHCNIKYNLDLYKDEKNDGENYQFGKLLCEYVIYYNRFYISNVISPRNHSLNLIYINILYKSKNKNEYVKCQQWCLYLLSIAPNQSDFLWWYTCFLFNRLNDYNECVKYCNKAIELSYFRFEDASNIRFYYRKVLALTNLKLYDELLTHCNEAITLFSEDGRFYYHKGIALSRLKDRGDEACVEFIRAIRLSGHGNSDTNKLSDKEKTGAVDYVIKTKYCQNCEWRYFDENGIIYCSETVSKEFLKLVLFGGIGDIPCTVTYTVGEWSYTAEKLDNNSIKQTNTKTKNSRVFFQNECDHCCGDIDPEDMKSECKHDKNTLFLLGFDEIRNSFYNTMDKTNYILCEIGRIIYKKDDNHNNTIQQCYDAILENKKKELMLFHGTQWSVVPRIVANGFNRDFNITSLYGKGVYFATDAIISDHYTQDNVNGQRVMLACSVIVGTKYVLGTKDGILEQCSIYDCMVNDVNNPRIFTITKDYHSIPKYKIIYRKI